MRHLHTRNLKTRTVHRRQRVPDRRPWSSPRLQRPGLGGLFFEARIFPSVAVEGPEAERGLLLLLGAQPHRQVVPQGGQEQLSLGPRGQRPVGSRSLLLRSREGRKGREDGEGLCLGAIDVRGDA